MIKHLATWIGVIGLLCGIIGNNQVLSFAHRLSLVNRQATSSNVQHQLLALQKQQSSKTTVLFAESESSSSSSSSRRRRKRKVTSQPKADSDEDEEETELSVEEETEEEETKEVELKPREATPVRLAVQDIRQAAGGAPATPSSSSSSSSSTPTPTPTPTPPPQQQQGSTTPLQGTVAAAAAAAAAATSSSSEPTSGKTFDDSIQMLLQDAREMQDAPLSSSSSSSESGNQEGGVIAKVLSTIVTVDFFVVCGLLLWFLAGIFCSYVLRDDTVQIAFNGIFESVVQPALGVLMIASIGSSVFTNDESDGP